MMVTWVRGLFKDIEASNAPSNQTLKWPPAAGPIGRLSARRAHRVDHFAPAHLGV